MKKYAVMTEGQSPKNASDNSKCNLCGRALESDSNLRHVRRKQWLLKHTSEEQRGCP
jgi:hypothetical protein